MASAANLYFPFDAGAGAAVQEDQWRKMARLWLPTGPIQGEGSQLVPFGDSTGLQVKVPSGNAWVRGHYAEFTGTRILPIASVAGIPGGQSRLDLVVLRADFVNNRVEVDVLTGTPAATGSQVAPSVTQSTSKWEVPLATVGPMVNTSSTIPAGSVVPYPGAIVGPSGITSSSSFLTSGAQQIFATGTPAAVPDFVGNTIVTMDCTRASQQFLVSLTFDCSYTGGGAPKLAVAGLSVDNSNTLSTPKMIGFINTSIAARVTFSILVPVSGLSIGQHTFRMKAYREDPGDTVVANPGQTGVVVMRFG